MNQTSSISFVMLIAFAIGVLLAHPLAMAVAQFDLDEQIEQFASGTSDERIRNLRSLSTLVIRDYAKPDERKKIIEFLKASVNDEVPVVRLHVHIEILKIGAADKNTQLIELAMKASDDKDINVRREILKHFSTYFSGRMEAGLQQKSMLLEKLSDPDLESRYQVAKTLLSWEIVNDKVLDILLDSLEMRNYRSSVMYALSTLPNRKAVVAQALGRLKKSEHNAAVLISLIAQTGTAGQAAINDVLPMYENDQIAVRAALVDAIGRVKLQSGPAVALLQTALEDEAPQVRQLVLTSTFSITTDPDRRSESVIRLLDDDNRNVREIAAAYACIDATLFSACIPKFREILSSDEAGDKYSIVGVLARAGPVAAPLAGEVKRLLRSDTAEMRGAACWAMLEIALDKTVVAEAMNREINETSEQDQSLAMLIGALAQAQPTDKRSRETFLKYLQHKDSNVRFACALGLGNYDSTPYADALLRIPPAPSARTNLLYDQLDQTIVETICKQETGSAELAKKYLADGVEGFVRARAIRIASKMEPDNADVQNKLLAMLDDADVGIRFAAADSLKYMPKVSRETLVKLLDSMDGNNRQATVKYLQLIGDLKEKSVPVVQEVAQLMNGKFRNRFANDARTVVVSMAPHIKHPVPSLAEKPITVQKLDCLAEIGRLDEASENSLREFMKESGEKAAAARNLNKVRLNRRLELLAAAALANGLSDNSFVNDKVLTELKGEKPELGLLAISKLKLVDKVLVDAMVARLPEAQTIEALTRLGSKARSAGPTLRKLIDSEDPKISVLAKRAVWRLEDDQQLAVKTLEELLAANAMQPGEIKLEYRQSIWELLRYLHDRHASEPEVKQLLDLVESGRFQNLRDFVKNLRSGK